MKLDRFEDMIKKVLGRTTRRLTDDEVMRVVTGDMELPSDADAESRTKIEIIRETMQEIEEPGAVEAKEPWHVLLVRKVDRALEAVASTFDFGPAPMPVTRSGAASSALYTGTVSGITVSAAPLESGVHLSLEAPSDSEISVEISKQGTLVQKATNVSMFDTILEEESSYKIKVFNNEKPFVISLLLK